MAGVAVGAAAAGPGGVAPQFKLTRLAPDDDIEAFLMTFEQTATLACWPLSQWTYILRPYLSGPAQTVWRTLPAAEVNDYAKLKKTLLDRYSVTKDSFRLRFWAVRYTRGSQPRAVMADLKEATNRWLKSAMPGELAIVEKVVLDQAYHVMPPEARVWVSQHRPPTLTSATQLLGNYIDVEPLEPRCDRSPGPRLHCPGRTNDPLEGEPSQVGKNTLRSHHQRRGPAHPAGVSGMRELPHGHARSHPQPLQGQSFVLAPPLQQRAPQSLGETPCGALVSPVARWDIINRTARIWNVTGVGLR